MDMEPVDIFRQEVEELFSQLETALLDLEAAPQDKENIGSAFRALHTIKGSGAMFGFDAVAKFTHHVETVFDRVRNGEVKISPGLIGVTLAAKDHMRLLIEAPETAPPGAGDSILADLARVIAADDKAAAASKAVAVPKRAPLVSAPAAIAAIVEAPLLPPPVAAGYRVRFELPPNAMLIGANPALMIRELLELGKGEVLADVSVVPPLDAMDPERCYLRWDVSLVTDQSVEAIEDVFLFVRDESNLTIEPFGDSSAASVALVEEFPVNESSVGESSVDEAPVEELSVVEKSSVRPVSSSVAAASPQPEIIARRSPSASKAPGEGVVKVNADRINSLMNQVGELVIAQSRLKQIAYSGEELSLLSLRAIAEEMGRLVSELRDATMSIRMAPIGSLFGRFRRVVRDLSRELGKEIQLITHGEETELDKTVVESLNDPLVHLIRNAIDHGVESAVDRLAAGKSSEGVVRLTAAHVGGQVMITISDDGKGMDRVRIRAKAEERGLLTPGVEVPDSELFELIFHPGFSTAACVTNVSGRGVGMDVVKRTIENLRGSIEVSSRPGEGSRITLRMPLTLAIIDGLLVRIGEGRYIVPLSAVDEIIEMTDADKEQSSANSFLFIRGGLIPFLRLRELFSTPGESPPYEKAVIVSSGERRIGLVVDQMLGDHQTVIKSLSRLHADVRCFSGATILGDGRVALILDIAHLIEYGQNRETRLRNAASPDPRAIP
ncbi:two-component system, chemotaxis family, sensor kinase CheA [Azospirillaceae bacterium]